MVSLSMSAKLLVALRPDARLVPVGDLSQLVSVEAGAVLADLGGEQADGRTASGTATLAAVLPGDAAATVVPDTPRAALRDGSVFSSVRLFKGKGPIDLLARAI